MGASAEYRYPPDDFVDTSSRWLSATALFVGIALTGALLDLALFGMEQTTVPYNYPFYFDVLLLCLVAVLLRLSHAVLWNIVDELVLIIRYNQDDPLSLSQGLDPDGVWTELENVLYLAYHPAVLAGGGLVGGALVVSIMAVLGVFEAYPYLIMNFGFGAAHGVFFGPVAGALYLFWRSYRAYIIDIDLLDPDGVGGYREIGNGIVKLATYGILIVTLDFIILSSVGFTDYTRFQVVVSAIYVTLLVVFVFGTLGVTVVFRKKLLAIRDRKVRAMQSLFVPAENEFWRKARTGEDNFSEAINILSMYAMFHQMDKMNMWPINLYSIVRLSVSIGFSLSIYYVQLISNLYDLFSVFLS